MPNAPVTETGTGTGWRVSLVSALSDARKCWYAYRTIRMGRRYGYTVSLIVNLTVDDMPFLRLVDKIADGQATHAVRSQAVRVPTLPEVDARALKVAPPD